MSKISKEQEYKIKANVLDHLINHLRERTDVQNIDLMNLSGFCRNCLSCLLYTSPSPRDTG